MSFCLVFCDFSEYDIKKADSGSRTHDLLLTRQMLYY